MTDHSAMDCRWINGAAVEIGAIAHLWPDSGFDTVSDSVYAT
jgi:hypothetical protein